MESPQFNEVDARSFYGILNHHQNEYTEIRILNPETREIIPGGQIWVQNESQFIDFIKPYSGKYTIWAGLNPRKTKGGKAENVARRTTILIDLDIHHTDGTPTTDEEIEKVIEKAKELANQLKFTRHPHPWIDVSGNGIHLLIIVDLPAQPDCADKVRDFYKSLEIVIDLRNADLARMCRVTGTYNVDAKRLSYLVTQGDYEQDKTLEAYLTSSGSSTTSTITLNESETKDKNATKRITRYKAKMRPCIRAMLTNENEGAHGQSGELDHEAHLLIVKDAQYNGLGYDEICTLFINQPDYKPKLTRDLVGKAIADNALKGITPWYCNNLIKRKWCTEDSELCGAVRWDPDEKRDKKNEPADKATELVNLAHENAVEFFRDQYRTPYAVVRTIIKATTDGSDGTDGVLQKHGEKSAPDKFGRVLKNTVNAVTAVSHDVTQTLAISSRAFKWWLSHLYHEKTGGVIGKEYINSASLLLEAETQTQPVRYLYNRFAPNGEFSYWWDMADDGGRAIHIDKDGWEIQPAPHIFIHHDHMMPLPKPMRTRDLSPLLDYLNLEDTGDKLLAIVGNISRLVPEVPRIGSVSTGLGGSGKSTWDLLTLYTLDPSSTDLLTIPAKDEDLIQVLEHHAVAIFDNVGSITKSQSDIFCRAITGAGVEKRELYTTDESYIRQFMHVIGFNGVSMPVERGDLFSRVILLAFKKIEDNQRKTFAEMKALIKKDVPQVVGAMLTVLVDAIRIYPMVKTRLNVRMSDYVRWGCAITLALGLKQSDFEEAYRNNVLGQDEEAVRASLVAEMIIKYMTAKELTHLEGSATELKEMLEVHEKFNGIDSTPLSKREGWPKGANKFGRDLSEVANNMTNLGYYVVTPKRARSEWKKYTIDKVVAKRDGPEAKGQRSFEAMSPDELTETRLMVALAGKVKDV